MKKLIALLTVCSLLAACNTVRGIGQDIKKTGEVIEGAATKK
jgi:predicted small secreted protein